MDEPFTAIAEQAIREAERVSAGWAVRVFYDGLRTMREVIAARLEAEDSDGMRTDGTDTRGDPW